MIVVTKMAILVWMFILACCLSVKAGTACGICPGPLHDKQITYTGLAQEEQAEQNNDIRMKFFALSSAMFIGYIVITFLL